MGGGTSDHVMPPRALGRRSRTFSDPPFIREPLRTEHLPCCGRRSVELSQSPPVSARMDVSGVDATPPPDAAGGSWRGMPGNFATVLPFLDEATRSELFSLPPNIRRAIRSARVSSRASRMITFYADHFAYQRPTNSL